MFLNDKKVVVIESVFVEGTNGVYETWFTVQVLSQERARGRRGKRLLFLKKIISGFKEFIGKSISDLGFPVA